MWQQLFYLHKYACNGVGGRSSMVSTVRHCAVRHRKEFQNRASLLTWAVHGASNRIDITYQLTMQCNAVFAADPRGRAG